MKVLMDLTFKKKGEANTAKMLIFKLELMEMSVKVWPNTSWSTPVA